MNLIDYTNKTSRIALIITSLYLLVVAAACIIMLLTVSTTPMSGIFLVFATLPWSFILTWIQEIFQLNSIIFNGLFLVAGGIVNGLILYKLISLITGRVSRQP